MQLIIITATAIIVIVILCGYFFHAYFSRQLLQALNKTEQLTNEKNAIQKEKDELIQRSATAESKVVFLEEVQKQYSDLQKEHQIVLQQFMHSQANLKNAELNLDHKKKEMEQIGEKFKFEFKNLAQSILEEKSVKFTELNQQKIGEILAPLKTQLVDFKQRVEDTYDKESKERFSLGKEVQRLITMTQQVSMEANNLTSALKGNSKMQGDWGELILESILENTGMTKQREYFLQEFLRDASGVVIKDENGKGLQPDAIIVYPDERKLIIDSKVSLVSWDLCMSEPDISLQKKYVQDLVKSIRSHIDGLSRKNYPRYASALDYVLMFIPIEAAFLEALKADHSLWKYAYDKHILLVSPTNLFAVLRIVADLWKVETQNKNAVDIANKAGSLYDKFVLFIDNFEIVGKRIAEANATYENAHKQLTSGRGAITTRVEELRKMGANAEKQLSQKILPDLEE